MSELEQAQRMARFAVGRILRYHPDDVDDVLQQSALKAVKMGSQFRGESKYSTYFVKIAINTALMFLRSSVVQCSGNFTSIGEDFDVVSTNESPEAFCIRIEREERIREKVWKAIDDLTPIQRSAAKRWLDGKPTLSNAEKSARHHVRVKFKEMVELKECY